MIKPNTKFNKFIELVIFVILIISTLIISIQFSFVDQLRPNTNSERYIMFIGIFFIFLIVLSIHELGHLITGLLQGFRFELFVIGPLGIKREDEKLKIFLNKNLGYYGGVSATSPINYKPENAIKFARILLAGPIASLLFAILCFLLAYIFGNFSGLLFYIGSLISITVFFATTIPSQTGAFFTDRKRYQRLVSPGEEQKVELAILKIMGTLSQDKSYKNIDIKDIYTIVSDKSPFIKTYGLFNVICYQLEQNDSIDEQTMKEYKDISSKISKSHVAIFDKEIERFKIEMKKSS